MHARDVDCRKKLFIGRKRIGAQRIAAKGVDIDEDFLFAGLLSRSVIVMPGYCLLD